MKMKSGFTWALTFLMAWRLCAQTNIPTPAPGTASTNAPTTNSPAAAVETTNATATKQKAPAKKKKKKVAKTTKPAAKPATETSATKSILRVPISPPETGIVRQRNVNVRGQPSFVGEVITKLHQGESVTLLEEITKTKTKQDEPSQWFRIAMPSNTPVWVSASFVDPATKTVVPRKLKVRAGPGENFSMVGILEKGTTVKEIRTVNDWMEIETPTDTYAFVAADLIERASSAPVPVPPPAPPEVVAVAPAPVEVPAQNVTPETPAPAPPATVPPVEVPAPIVTTPPPVVEEPLPKRIVTREGIIRRSLNVQTPSYFALENPETRKIINYLYHPEPGFTLKTWVGHRAVVTGEESIDKRWPNTPVIEIETIDPR